MRSSTARKAYDAFIFRRIDKQKVLDKGKGLKVSKGKLKKPIVGRISDKPKVYKDIQKKSQSLFDDMVDLYGEEKDTYTKQSIVKSAKKLLKGKRQTDYKYIHKKGASLQTKSNKIMTHFVITDEDGASTVRSIEVHRKKKRTPKQWSAFIEKDFAHIMNEYIAPNTPSLEGIEYKLDLIGFEKK